MGCCLDPPVAKSGVHGVVSNVPAAHAPHAMSTVVVAVLVGVVVGLVLCDGVVVCDEVPVVLVAVDVAVDVGEVVVVAVVVSVVAVQPRNEPAT